MTNVLALHTFKTVDDVIAEDNYIRAFRFRPQSTRGCEYVVCIRNTSDARYEGDEPHDAAFMIVRLDPDAIEPDHQMANRFRIKVRCYATLPNLPNRWLGNRNPVLYTTLEDLDISLDGLEWIDLPEQEPPPFTLTPEQAKVGLAQHFGTTPDKINITVQY
jgi:hypothetical protein